MDTLRGKLLISAGGLYDPNFRHTVVLIGSHDESGAVGVVLNRPLQVTVAQAAPVLAGLVGPGEPIFQGGPVAPAEAVLLVDLAPPGLLDVPVLDTIGFLTGDVPADAAGDIRRARVFVGHSGWGPGQLEAELEAGAWLVEPAQPADVFTADAAALWKHVLDRKGPPYATMARIPFDPRVN
jgi:putative transcriptional regulator